MQELWEAYRQRGEASGYLFLVCKEEAQVLGFLCFGPTPLTTGTFDLYWIAVDPSAQGQGVGHALMERMEREVALRAGRLILVETSGTLAYAEARRFYEACGYHYQAVVHDFYRPGDDLVILGKLLAPEPPPTQPAHSHLASHAP
ncbi:MAG: GNAT family N-acetyltransferase [Anaerolineae bacterium]